MNEIIPDEKIQELLQERKMFHIGWRKNFTIGDKPNDNQHTLVVMGDAEHEFRITVRINKISPLKNFSVVLGIYYPESDRVFHLRRYNGNSHQHTNSIPRGQKGFIGFHIHYATEEYQIAGEDEDAYAKRTDRYQDVSGALECLMEDANFQGNPTLFKEIKRCLLGL